MYRHCVAPAAAAAARDDIVDDDDYDDMSSTAEAVDERLRSTSSYSDSVDCLAASRRRLDCRRPAGTLHRLSHTVLPSSTPKVT